MRSKTTTTYFEDIAGKRYALRRLPLRKLKTMEWFKFFDLHGLINEKQWREVYFHRTGHKYN